MSPILVRPVREQLEHDRVIRLLQQDLQKRKVEVGINPGAEQNASVGSGSRREFPDAVVYSLEKGRKVVAVLEVETGESVNYLEAMAQWAHLAKLRVPFHLYVPINSVDVARRLSNDHKIAVTEIWSYHQVGEQFKFTLMHPISGPRGGRGSTQPPRTVSVATIRVALPTEPEPPVVEEPVVKPQPTPATKAAARAQGIKTIPARIVTPAPPPATTAIKAPVTKVVPRVVPVKAAVKPALVKPVQATPVPEKAKPVVARSTPASKVAPVKPPANSAAKATAKPTPTPKPSSKAPARALAARATPAPSVTASRPAATRARPVVKSAAKPAAKLR